MLGLRYRAVNQDGSRNVFCPRCREFVGTASATAGINSATCAVCVAFDEGIDLTQEQVDAIRAVRVNNSTLSVAAVTPQYVEDPMSAVAEDKEEAKVGRKGNWLKAFVKAVQVGAKILREETFTESKKIAKANKPKRIFEQDIDEQ